MFIRCTGQGSRNTISVSENVSVLGEESPFLYQGKVMQICDHEDVEYRMMTDIAPQTLEERIVTMNDILTSTSQVCTAMSMSPCVVVNEMFKYDLQLIVKNRCVSITGTIPKLSAGSSSIVLRLFNSETTFSSLCVSHLKAKLGEHRITFAKLTNTSNYIATFHSSYNLVKLQLDIQL